MSTSNQKLIVTAEEFVWLQNIFLNSTLSDSERVEAVRNRFGLPRVFGNTYAVVVDTDKIAIDPKQRVQQSRPDP